MPPSEIACACDSGAFALNTGLPFSDAVSCTVLLTVTCSLRVYETSIENVFATEPSTVA